jgi:hypothetical protein
MDSVGSGSAPTSRPRQRSGARARVCLPGGAGHATAGLGAGRAGTGGGRAHADMPGTGRTPCHRGQRPGGILSCWPRHMGGWDREEGLRVAEEALAVSRTRAELYRLKGKLLLRRSAEHHREHVREHVKRWTTVPSQSVLQEAPVLACCVAPYPRQGQRHRWAHSATPPWSLRCNKEVHP